MSEASVKPRWFKLACRALTTLILIGLFGLLIFEVAGVRPPILVMMFLGALTYWGVCALLVVQWDGVARGYVRRLEAGTYTLIAVSWFFIEVIANFWMMPS